MAKRATRLTSRLNIISDKNNRKIRLHCGNWLRAKYDAFKLTVTGVLDLHNTDKKLIKAWPEVEQFIPYQDKPKSTAVALDVKTLNEICGIPR